jgi:hypothetical protein
MSDKGNNSGVSGNSFANGWGGKPPEVAASEVTFWDLINQDPHVFAS